MRKCFITARIIPARSKEGPAPKIAPGGVNNSLVQ